MRKLKNENCVECGKNGVKSKGFCSACYLKSYRKTPQGQASLKLYNKTKGKLAQKRYLSKQPLKPTKAPKEIKLCNCGSLVKVGKLCNNCYHRNYRKINPKPKIPKLPKNYTEIYKKVLNEVQKGNTISNSCIIVGVSTCVFYKNITDIQKREIKTCKIIGKTLDLDWED